MRAFHLQGIPVAQLTVEVRIEHAPLKDRCQVVRSRDYLHGLVEEAERATRRILNEHGAELADSFWRVHRKLKAEIDSESKAGPACQIREAEEIK